jgi:peptidoglycan hydrolase FlgJ
MTDSNSFGLSNVRPATEVQMARQQMVLDKVKQVGEQAPAGTKEIEKAAGDFEAMLVGQMLKEMHKTVGKDGLLKSDDEETYQEMYTDAISQEIAKGQGIGVKSVIMRELYSREGLK